MSAVARRLGVAPATLRTWDRRYGLGPGEHVPGAHRRYSLDDLARLELMKRLTHDGVAPADAAASVLAGDPDGSDRVGVRRGGRPARARPVAPAPAGPAAACWRCPAPSASVRGLARAAMTLDAEALERSLREQPRRGRGGARPGTTCSRRCWSPPAHAGPGTGEGVDVEHLLSECASAALREVGARLPHRPRATCVPVLLACGPDDAHSLPLYALAAALAERGVTARVLGARLPAAALRSAVPGPGRPRVSSGPSSPPPPTRRRCSRCRHPPPDGRRSWAAPAGPGWSCRRGSPPARASEDAVARL